MIDRRAFLAGTGAVLFAAPLAAEAQLLGKPSRIGFLAPAPSPLNIDAFRDGMRELGYVEPSRLALEIRWGDGRLDRLPGFATELAQLRVDVIVTDSTAATLAAKHATTTIPIVMGSGTADPVGQGLVASIARPGGNVTGLMLPSLDPKRLHPLAVKTAKDLDPAFAQAKRAGVDGLVVMTDYVLLWLREHIVELAARYRFPGIYMARPFIEAGGLLAYGVNVPANFRRAATLVDKILKGAKPSDLLVGNPARIELFVNLKTAKALGLTIPPSLLGRADEVIQ